MFIIANRCRTIADDPCTFPFIYNDRPWYECTDSDWEVPWCATAVTANGQLVSGKWDGCAPGCPGVQG